MAYQTSTNHYQNTKYIVDAIAGASPYATIQSAINAANTAAVPCTVFIRPGTYTENLTLYDGVNLEGGDNALVTIVGKHVPPDSGDITFTRIGFQSATNVMEKASAGTTVLRFTRCRFIIADGYACHLTAWTGDLRFRYCTEYSTSVTSAIIYNATGTAPVIISYCSLGAGTAKTMTIFGAARIESSRIICPSSFNGTATSAAYGGCFFDGMITIADTANLSLANSTISTGATTAITITSTTPMTLANVVIKTSHATAIAGTGTVNFSETTFVDSKGLAGTIVEGLTGVVKTGEIYADTIQRMEDSGFYSWAAAAPYFDDTTLGTFQLLVGGTGYIKGKLVTWSAQNIAGMTSGATWWIYIDNTGTIGKTSTRTDALFVNNIVLFECLYDETTGTKQQHTARENHPYNYPVGVSNYLHDTVGAVIENANNGANIVAGTTNVRVSISGDDVLSDHGLDTTITAATDRTWKKFYKNAAGKWAVDATGTDFAGRFNSAGTPTNLTAGKYAVYRLYVGKDSGNAATPTYYAVLNSAEYNNAGAAASAIAAGTISVADGELASLELAQLGFITQGPSTGGPITTFTISKSTLRSTISGGSGSSVATGVSTNTTNFDGILSGADTNVQAALETIDEFGKNLTDKALVVGNGNGFPLGVISVGATGTILTGVTANDPTWTTATYPATLAKGLLMVATAANVINGLTGSTGTAGQILTSGGAATEPTWTTATYPATLTKGDVLCATAANVVGVRAAGTSGQIMTAVTSDIPAWTTATYPATLAKGLLMVATAANVIDGLTGSTGTAGQILTSGGAATEPTWTTATYPATLTKGDVLCATAANVVGVRAAGTSGQIMTAVTSDIPAWTTATYPSTIAKGEVLCATDANVIGVVSGTGTAGQVLTSNGAASAPTWQAAGGGLAKVDATGDATAAVNTQYTINHATPANLLTLTLPASYAVGDRIEIIGNTAGLWKLVAATGDTIKMVGSTTSSGGYLLATVQYDAVAVVCTVANTTWVVCSSMGNLTIA